MADTYTRKIRELEAQRRKNLRQAKRARQRRRKALRQRRWKDARRSLGTARRNNREAQDNLKRIRTLRKARSRANRLARIARHNRRVIGKTGLMWMNGRAVPRWIYDELQKAKGYGWRGYVVSGVRTSAYSRSLCFAMCGAPKCPGRCAGVDSNHNADPPYAYPDGAVDVTDFRTLFNICERHDLRIKNRLPNDRVHFSARGV